MGSYKITKIVITVVYSLILIYALTRLNTTTTVRMESKCANPSQSKPFCAQCFKVPTDIHNKSHISVGSPIQSAVSINSCKSFTCQEMLQLFDSQKRKVALRQSAILNILTNLLKIQESPTVSRHHLQKNKHLVFYTSQDTDTLTLYERMQFMSQGITPVVNTICSMTLLFLLYVMICQKQFSMACTNILAVLSLLVFIIVDYNWPMNSILMGAITHGIYVFFVMDCAKIEVGYSIIGCLISIQLEYFRLQRGTHFLSIIMNIIILALTVFAVRNQYGTNERFAILVMLLYTVMMIGWTVEPNAAPFQLLLLFLMNWSAAMLYVFSIQNVEFIEYGMEQPPTEREEEEVEEQEEDLQESQNKLETE